MFREIKMCGKRHVGGKIESSRMSTAPYESCQFSFIVDDNESYLCRKTTSTSTSSRSSCKKSLRKWDTDSYVMCPQTTICLCIFEIQLWRRRRQMSEKRWMLIESNLIFCSSTTAAATVTVGETGAIGVDGSSRSKQSDWLMTD